MNADRRTRATHYREVLLAMRSLEAEGVYHATAQLVASLVPTRPEPTHAGHVRSVARTLAGMNRRGFVHSEHANARTWTDSEGRHTRQARQTLNQPNLYWLTVTGDIAADMLEAAPDA